MARALLRAGHPDYSGTLQKVFGLVDHMAYIGAGIYHRDCGWWNTAGDWQGPDWKISKDYLSKYGMQQLIYYWAYDANTDSKITRSIPTGSVVLTLRVRSAPDRPDKPGAEQWVTDLLINDAKKWGNYEWRNDSCPVGAPTVRSSSPSRRDYQNLQETFLNAEPGSAIQHVDSGGNEVNYEGMRMASSFSITDLSGVPEQHDASMLFPTDKMSGIPDAWNPANCNASYNTCCSSTPTSPATRTMRRPWSACGSSWTRTGTWCTKVWPAGG